MVSPITSASDMDSLDWSRAVDQYGNIDSDSAGYGYSIEDILVKTINGVTYVVGTFENGDIMLHEYVPTYSANGTPILDANGDPVYGFHKLAHYQGGSDPADYYGGYGKQLISPALELQDGHLIITAETQENPVFAWTYDLNSDPSTYDPDTEGLVFRDEVLAGQNLGAGSGNDELQSFDINGQTYYIHIGFDGIMRAHTAEYDAATDTLTFNYDQQYNATAFINDQPYLGSRLVRTDRLDDSQSQTINTDIVDTSFVQVGDVIYGYSAGAGGYTGASFYVTKWEVDPDTGQMTGSQVVYTDGTTTKDLYDQGIVNLVDYPAMTAGGGISLRDLAASGNNSPDTILNWLQEIAGLPRLTDVDGSIDTIDFTDIRATESFVVDGQQYLLVNGAGREDGWAIFLVDSTTGLPTQCTGFVEMDESAGDPDDFQGRITEQFSDITLQQVEATGEYVISVAAGTWIGQFKFDPTAAPSLQNGEGQLTFIGSDVTNNTNANTLDSDPTNAAMTGGGITSQYELLPDGKILSADAIGYWLSDPTPAAICFVEGTLILTILGQVPIETLQVGDLVVTKDHGLQPIRWIGKRTRRLKSTKKKQDKMRPIRIKAGALGAGIPTSDLYVSPQHRILVKSDIIRRVYGSSEILVAAKHLLAIDGVDIVMNCDEVTYVHFLFDGHEIVYSNGAESESLYTGPEALKTVSDEGRHEILELFPELNEFDYRAVSGRSIPPNPVARRIIMRHAKNKKPLYPPRNLLGAPLSYTSIWQ